MGGAVTRVALRDKLANSERRFLRFSSFFASGRPFPCRYPLHEEGGGRRRSPERRPRPEMVLKPRPEGEAAGMVVQGEGGGERLRGDEVEGQVEGWMGTRGRGG